MIVVPKGKRIIIRNQDNEDVTGVPMILDEPITMSLSSQFEPLLNSTNTKTLNILGGLLSDVSQGRIQGSGQFKQFGFQVWTNTDPLMTNVTVTFRVDKTDVDAEAQVYRPALALMKLPLPIEGGAGNSMAGSNLIGPGPSVIATVKGATEAGVNTTTQGAYSVRMGRVLYIPNAIIKKAEPTFSIETDERGFPIWAKINMDIQSSFVATQQLLEKVNERGS